ncbi:MAG: dTDP-4-dehydrorhamnose 3,5-epimerase [Candidatus Moranbacteria bacterium]|nr:dTDP-4-dehydrorhamnose 3,5-epimerase [Candidatus Moranbacteria bacterium]
MEVSKTDLEGVLIIEPRVFADDRGFFMETYNRDRYVQSGIAEVFIQDNVSVSKKGTLRGLHYQAPPFAQGKLIQVVRGSVLDVAVDVRFGSPTFGKHVSIELSAENKKQFFIPAGFAHGFVALEDDTIFSYKCTNLYSPECDRGVLWSDAQIGIDWPFPESELLISEKDRKQPLLKDIAEEFVFGVR